MAVQPYGAALSFLGCNRSIFLFPSLSSTSHFVNTTSSSPPFFKLQRRCFYQRHPDREPAKADIYKENKPRFQHYMPAEEYFVHERRFNQYIAKEHLLPSIPPPQLTFEEAVKRAREGPEKPHFEEYKRIRHIFSEKEFLDICAWGPKRAKIQNIKKEFQDRATALLGRAPNMEDLEVLQASDPWMIEHPVKLLVAHQLYRYDVDWIHQDDTPEQRQRVKDYIAKVERRERIHPPLRQTRKGTQFAYTVPEKNIPVKDDVKCIKYVLLQMDPAFVEYGDKFETWEEFWKTRGRGLRAKEIPCKHRKKILRLKDNIRRGTWILEPEHLLPPHLRPKWRSIVTA